jgi:signal transduction histidine kinase
VTISTDACAPAPPVLANDGELRQVMLNLILNAVQACEPGGKVELSMCCDGASSIVRVKDDGRGLSPEQMERIFEPFFSLRPDGTGLGLFISKKLMGDMAGELRARSEEGKGSLFEVVLRRATVQEGASVGESVPNSPSG